ncbi:MAG TPA: RNA polymerase subunit sigma [Planctomycetaceae bacterium]|nr:RNA polymerase subunit sigma [Planctomycetaceae bacterium]HCC99093.1 RNA polymerase subunit sigma [Planctomycetaceae bacterium]
MAVNNLNDQQLLELCRDGDDAAFGVLVERHQDRLFHSLVSMLKSREDAVDIVQEAFFQAHRKLDTFRGDSAFYTWLYRIATNRALSFLRKQKQKPTSIEGLNETSGFDPPAPDDHSQPLKMVLREEHRQLVRETLDELSDDYRVVLVMKEFEGLRYDEIAELTENPIGTVRSRIHRGRIELADRLKRKLENWGDTE